MRTTTSFFVIIIFFGLMTFLMGLGVGGSIATKEIQRKLHSPAIAWGIYREALDSEALRHKMEEQDEQLRHNTALGIK